MNPVARPHTLLDPALAAAARVVLARPPRPPSDPDLFSSNTLFGQPGIYPEGSPMLYATGPPLSAADARRHLGSVATPAALAWFDDENTATVVPDPGVRAALAMLWVTVAAPAIAAFPNRTEAETLRYGTPASPGRVVGPSIEAATSQRDRVVNDRYRAEHPALISSSLAHDLLWNPAMKGHAAETVLHALVAMVHIQLVAAQPALARAGTELARRQNSLAITLLNSRQPGSHRVVLCAPDGPGTIPGGAPTMQTPDFWSVPFGPVEDQECPALIGEVIAGLVTGAKAPTRPPRLDENLGPWLSDHLDPQWLPVRDHGRVAVALGLIALDDIADAAARPVSEVGVAFGLEPAW